MSNKIAAIREKLGQFSPENMETRLPLLHRLLDGHYHNTVAVDIERAVLMTDYFRQTEGAKMPMPIRRAGAIKAYLSQRKIYFHDDNLLGGATTGKALGAPLYPEFLGLSIWPELHTISTRNANPQYLDPKDAQTLNFEVFPYWVERSISEEVRKVDPYHQSLLEKLIIYTISKAATISHTTPCYEKVLKKGIIAIMQEAAEKEAECGSDPDKKIFYQSVQVAMEGILDYAANISKAATEAAAKETDHERKQTLLDIAKVCQQVPAQPATTYREAVNALWISQVAVFAENSNMAINPGRLDQILYSYFIKEYESGTLTLEDALNISGCLWFKIADNVNLVPKAAEKLFGGAGSVPAITLGGVDQEGNDAVNELTYLLLKVTELLPIRDPNVNARYHPEKNSIDYRNEVSRVILSTKAIPAFYNDIQNIETLVHQGQSLEHARDYAVIGCVELGSAGRDYSASSSIFMMMYTILYTVLHNGRTTVTGDQPLWKATGEPESFKTFDDLWEAYREQTRLMVENAVALNNTYGLKHQEFLPTPLLSALFEGPMEKGKDLIFGGAVYNASGVTHIGFADVCDSLCAIKEICFNPDNKQISMSLPEFVQVVDNDFKDNPALLAYLANHAPKYGTDDPLAVEISKKLIDLEFKLFNNQKNYRWGNYRVAYWTMTNHAGYGSVSGALPNGRRANVPFASGITPASQIRTQLTESLTAVASLNSDHTPGAYALNMKYSPLPITPENVDRFGSVVQAYMQEGGQQVQFNIYDYKDLQRAQAAPDDYPHLLVRVSGYSAYFKSLNRAMQDELITRSQYDLSNGKFIPLNDPKLPTDE